MCGMLEGFTWDVQKNKPGLMSENHRPSWHIQRMKTKRNCAMNAKRYIGLDVHKRQVVVAVVDQQQNVRLKPVKIKMKNFPS